MTDPAGDMPEETGEQLRLSFWWGAAIELLLLLLALIVAWLLPLPLEIGWHWDGQDFTSGLLGTIPMLLVFGWLMRTRVAGLRRIRRFIQQTLRPVLQRWSVLQLLAISSLAGVSEEVLFRAVVQRGLAGVLGPLPAMIVAGALFGLCHWITPAYALVAGLMGCYLGGLWWWSGNLLTPVVAHGLYDFVALIWVLRLQRQ